MHSNNGDKHRLAQHEQKMTKNRIKNEKNCH